jgi:hypothetical protein
MADSLQTIAGGILSVATILGFIGGQAKRKIAAASLMMARIQGNGGDPLGTLSAAMDAEAQQLLASM